MKLLNVKHDKDIESNLMKEMEKNIAIRYIQMLSIS